MIVSARDIEGHLEKLVVAAQTIMDFCVALGAARPRSKLSVRDLLAEFQTQKERLGKSKRYLRQMRVSVHGLFGEALGQPIADVTREELQRAVRELGLAPRTARGYFLDVATLFNFAVRQEYLARSPAKFIELPKQVPKPPALHTPEEVRRVLHAAREFNPNFCRELAVRYFAGLRSAEAGRLAEDEIKPDHIEVTAAKSKTRRRRLVEITPNLRAWLALGGTLPVGRTSGMAKRVAELAGCEWPANVTRHSFCSYHLAKFGSAGRTALEAGHTEAMLFNHYREVVTKAAAEAFFGIVPERGGEVNERSKGSARSRCN